MTAAIVVTNVAPGEALPHPLVLLEGRVEGLAGLGLPATECFLDARLDAQRGCFWPVALGSGAFKALVLLPPTPGRHAITLRLGPLTAVHEVEYRPIVSRYRVKFYYQKCSDAAPHEGFDAPPGMDNSDRAAIDRIRFTALLLQTATAEMFRHAGLPRRTFVIELAADGLPAVQLLRTSFPNAEARRIHDHKLIHLIEQDLEAQGHDAHDEHEFKHAVILGCSTYNPATGRPEGHTALGGHKVGIFGSCGLHTWPRHLGEVTPCCLDNRRIDTTRLMDDSCHRKTHWANFATGIGAFLHELGHTFGLGHSTSGIMGRGFDDLNRLFCAYQADHEQVAPGFFQDHRDGRVQLNHPVLQEVTGPAGAHWNYAAAMQLIHCPWISAQAKASTCGPTVSWDKRVRGPVGQGQHDGTQHPFRELVTAPEELGAVIIEAENYLERVSVRTRAQAATLREGSSGKTHTVVLQPGEYITHVEVRAMAWIDGLRIHTNRRETQWFGGQGGQPHVLRPDEGSHVSGFFGSRGDHFVGRLGVTCSGHHHHHHHHHHHPQSSPVQVGPVGYGDQDGPQRPFHSSAGGDQDTDLGAVLVEGTDFVDAIRTYSRSEFAALSPSQRESGPGRAWFVLAHGEYITRVDVRAMCWVDGVGLHTNQRASPWFGGQGGEMHSLEPPQPGLKVHGFFGTMGNCFVGKLGIVCSSIMVTPPPPPPSAASNRTGPVKPSSRITLLGMHTEPPFETTGPAAGVLVAVASGRPQLVRSFDSEHARQQLIKELQAFQQPNTTLSTFTLQPGEMIIQLSASVTYSPNGSAIVEGLCVHTTTRCSSWLGSHSQGELFFVSAAPGESIRRLSGIAGTAAIVDIAVELSPREEAAFTPLTVGAAACGGGPVSEAPASFDIRVQSQSEFGIQSVLLRKRRDGENIDQHAWTWRQGHLGCPTRWCLPQCALEPHVHGGGGHEDKRKVLFRDYVLAAVDAGGACSEAAGPPEHLDHLHHP